MSKVPANVQDGQAGTMTVPNRAYLDGWEWFESDACKWCGEPSDLQANAQRLDEWRHGAPIMFVWPNMSDEVRELMLFGTHPECGRIQR